MLFALAFAYPAAATLQPVQQLLPKSVQSVMPAAETSQRCCKVCRKGKACGDSCISEKKQCTKGAGCACNASGGS